MSRTIRDECLDAGERILVRHECAPDVAHSVILEIVAAFEGRGVHIPRTVRVEDPVANAATDPSVRSDGGPGEDEYRRTKIMLRTGLTSGTLDVLDGCGLGQVERGLAHPDWLWHGNRVNEPVLALHAGGYVVEQECADPGMKLAVPTEAGLALLDELAGRDPKRDGDG